MATFIEKHEHQRICDFWKLLVNRLQATDGIILKERKGMFIIQSTQPSYSGHIFASSSCCTEYDGEVESELNGKICAGSLSRCGLRRSGSSVSEVAVTDRCQSDATQIELDFTVKCEQQLFVRTVTPCGEVGILQFDGYDTKQVFRPKQHGCGNGIWTIHVFQVIEHSEILLSTVSMPFNGVGTLYFAIGDDLHPTLVGKEFLHMPGACRKHSM
ncbi:hypothetical protein KIN20_034873 [Parelaphostrongylus tenuis]|uniref:Uncharacterized protein n=1 Tax=Parelaphostrongylus tenuis TaxID=148309 RepID=A0AAD5WK07_PARTN|nr:hypothetical protein KIN20_034873 [Parelaphostrongylus tenuis]